MHAAEKILSTRTDGEDGIVLSEIERATWIEHHIERSFALCETSDTGIVDFLQNVSGITPTLGYVHGGRGFGTTLRSDHRRRESGMRTYSIGRRAEIVLRHAASREDRMTCLARAKVRRYPLAVGV